MPTLCPSLCSLRFTAFPTPTCSTKKSGRHTSIHHHPPPPPFRAPSPRGRRCGVNTGPSGRRLRAPSAAQSLSSPSSTRQLTVPVPVQPSAHMRRQGNSSEWPQPSSAPLPCLFRLTRPYPHPHSPFQSNTNISHLWLPISATHTYA
jgi:hypothetical protein